jgi:hypothetical protein
MCLLKRESMKLTYAERKALEQQAILKRALEAGVKARPRGNAHVEMDNQQFQALVDRCGRFEKLLGLVMECGIKDRDLCRDIEAALEGR